MVGKEWANRVVETRVPALRLGPGLALIFDLDGVIVDSMPLHTLAWQPGESGDRGGRRGAAYARAAQ